MKTSLFAIGLSMFALASSAATLDVYISSPGSQATFVPGATTETFNSLNTGNREVDYLSAIGTYKLNSTARFNIQDADQFGGADNTKYLAFGAQSSSSDPIELILDGTYTYFGFWWSAGDVNNGLSFYHNDLFLARFSTGDITQLLSPSSGPTVTAINGTEYEKSLYGGNPNTGQNSGESYAYVHVIARGTRFNRIVFDNSNTTGTGFETDNHSVAEGEIEPDGGTVLVREVNSVAATPEPASMFLMGFGLLAAGVYGRKVRRVR